MNSEQILEFCLENMAGSFLAESWGEKGVFYNPGQVLKRGVYILTIKEKDGENDKGSNLDRPGIFRVNLGLHLESVQSDFEEIKPYIREACKYAKEKFAKRKK